jgi:hypothetical protein
MTLLATERIHPYYAQVEFSDPANPDYPEWGAGDVSIVATSSCIAVGTRPDHLGDVDVEVWLGAPDDEALMGAPKWTGRVRLSGDHAVIGNTVGNHLVSVELTRGDYQVRVFTLPVDGLAEKVIFSVQAFVPQGDEGTAT